jgi:circadian clock protein KaiB
MRKAGTKNRPARAKSPGEDFWKLKLYVAGRTMRSNTAAVNLEGICEKYLKGRYRITVVDLKEHPEIALKDQIVVTPTVIREFPQPQRRIIGDLSQKDKVLIGLDILARPIGEVSHG